MQNGEHNFISHYEIFDVRVAVQEILTILEQKASVKRLNLSKQFLNFENNYIVKTDGKRMQ
jgi:hypothetical protein